MKAYLDGPASRTFIDLRKPGAMVPTGHVHAAAPGYRGSHQGRVEIWLPHACFERISGGKSEANALKAELHEKRLITSEGRGSGRSFSVKRDIPGLGRVRVIALQVNSRAR